MDYRVETEQVTTKVTTDLLISLLFYIVRSGHSILVRMLCGIGPRVAGGNWLGLASLSLCLSRARAWNGQVTARCLSRAHVESSKGQHIRAPGRVFGLAINWLIIARPKWPNAISVSPSNFFAELKLWSIYRVAIKLHHRCATA